MNLTRENLTIPNPDPRGDSIVIRYDMRRVFEAEARIEEISFISNTKAPELLTKFSLAMKDLGEHLADLGYRESVAKRKMRERRAVVVMEVIPAKLAEKKLSNNDTNREAVIDLDPEYSASTDVLNQIESSFILIREKLRGIESAINSTKKVLDTLPTVFTPNPSLVTPLYAPYQQPVNPPPSWTAPFVQPLQPNLDPPYEITCTPVTEKTTYISGASNSTAAPISTRFSIGKARH